MRINQLLGDKASIRVHLASEVKNDCTWAFILFHGNVFSNAQSCSLKGIMNTPRAPSASYESWDVLHHTHAHSAAINTNCKGVFTNKALHSMIPTIKHCKHLREAMKVLLSSSKWRCWDAVTQKDVHGSHQKSAVCIMWIWKDAVENPEGEEQ